MIQQFIHTIAKEEIAKLTVEEFKGRIITILSKEEADKAVEYLLRFPIVGFDTETRPSFKKGQRYKISLMQISRMPACKRYMRYFSKKKYQKDNASRIGRRMY